jgi:hypothetical protein
MSLGLLLYTKRDVIYGVRGPARLLGFAGDQDIGKLRRTVTELPSAFVWAA